MLELIAEAWFIIEKRQTLEQQSQKLKLATEFAKSKECVKFPRNTKEVNEIVDAASNFSIPCKK